MQKWECATIPLIIHSTKAVLGTRSDNGWELVAVIPGPDGQNLVAYLKRPKDWRMGFSDRLAELGIGLPPVAAPVAAYVPTTHFDNVIHTSGQLPLTDNALLAKGKIGSDVPIENVKGLARVAALNVLAAATTLVGGLDGLSRVVHVTVLVSSAPGFTGRAVVTNGASEVLGEIFGEAGGHSRSAVSVAVLPLDTPTEVEVQFATV